MDLLSCEVMFLWLCVLCAVVRQRRSYSTFLTLMVWLLTAQDLLLLDSGEEEVQEEVAASCLVVKSAGRFRKKYAERETPQRQIIIL